MMKARFVFLFATLAPFLFWACATNKATGSIADPVAVLSFSSEGAVPAAFTVIPSSFILPALQELTGNGALGDSAHVLEFLNEFFSRADSVFAAIMHNSDSGALFCRVLAFGKFPSRIRMMLNSSRGWERCKEGDALWFESSAFTAGRVLRAAIPASGVLLAEIDIAAPSGKRVEDGASSSMADFIAATTANPAAQQDLSRLLAQGDGAGEMFFSSLDAALLGAASVPLAFYAPDFNLFARSVLPAVPGFPLAGAVAALSAFEGFSLPISSIEFTVDKSDSEPAEDGASFERLTAHATIPSAALTRAAAVIVQLMFPDGSVTAENGAITVQKELPAGRAALAVLSLFLVS